MSIVWIKHMIVTYWFGATLEWIKDYYRTDSTTKDAPNHYRCGVLNKRLHASTTEFWKLERKKKLDAIFSLTVTSCSNRTPNWESELKTIHRFIFQKLREKVLWESQNLYKKVNWVLKNVFIYFYLFVSANCEFISCNSDFVLLRSDFFF